MRATRIFANLRVADIEAAKSFYTDYLGLSNEEFNMGWVARYASADAKAKVQLVTRDATAPEDSVISVCTDDIDGAYAEARELGRDRPSTEHGGMGAAAILRAGTRRQSDQHREPPGLTFR
jgi:predicted enzyme related to lactoylglutathione lyase